MKAWNWIAPGRKTVCSHRSSTLQDGEAELGTRGLPKSLKGPFHTLDGGYIIRTLEEVSGLRFSGRIRFSSESLLAVLQDPWTGLKIKNLKSFRRFCRFWKRKSEVARSRPLRNGLNPNVYRNYVLVDLMVGNAQTFPIYSSKIPFSSLALRFGYRFCPPS